MDWKKRAYELWLQQKVKDIKAIREQIYREYGRAVHREHVKSAIYKQRDKEKKEEPAPPPQVFGNEQRLVWDGTQEIKIGIISDTHLCSKYQQLTHLNKIYDIFKAEGITQVFHAGDLVDGYYKNDDSRLYELFRIGADEQTDYVIQKYPKRDGMTTFFILGNHDLTHVRNGGTNISKRIVLQRPDMIYLGAMNALVFLTENCTLELNHPADGASYALSYSIQKMIDSYQGGQKPSILLNGHHHKYINLDYRNVNAVEVGCFQAQTPFMRSKRIAANVGGLILTIMVDEAGTIRSFTPSWIPFYDVVPSDY